jgi:hypothetical protein
LLDKKIDSECEIGVSVTNPRDQKGHIVYDVKGIDKDGTFEVVRRFNDFYYFR